MFNVPTRIRVFLETTGNKIGIANQFVISRYHGSVLQAAILAIAEITGSSELLSCCVASRFYSGSGDVHMSEICQLLLYEMHAGHCFKWIFFKSFPLD